VFDPRKIIEALNRHKVEYITIGGFAATLLILRMASTSAWLRSSGGASRYTCSNSPR